jgi:hypothetical protein
VRGWRRDREGNRGRYKIGKGGREGLGARLERGEKEERRRKGGLEGRERGIVGRLEQSRREEKEEGRGTWTERGEIGVEGGMG